MNNYFKKGFTLIELLVVISIIGILSGVVLASLSTARTAAYNAKVKAQLTEIRNAADTYYASNYNYGTSSYWASNGTTTNGCAGGMFQDSTSGLSKLTVSVNYPVGENTIACNSNGNSYAVSDNLSASSTYWCVDSNGSSKQESAALASSTACL